MRTATVFALVLCAMAGAAQPSGAQAAGTDSSAVAGTVRQFHDALARGDSAAALALLADDAVVLEGGGVESREEYRAHHLAADMRFAAAAPGQTSPLRVFVRGDAAWVTSTTEVRGTGDGRPVNSTSAELVVLTRTPTGWHIRAIHWSSRRRATP